MIIRPFLARTIGQACRRVGATKLSPQQTTYLMLVIEALVQALKTTAKPSCHWPMQPVTGWELTTTPIFERSTMRWVSKEVLHELPVEQYLGARTLYVKPSGGLRAVMTAPKRNCIGAHIVVAVSRTNIPRLLDEDPSLFDALLTAVDQKIQQYELGYRRPPLLEL